MESPQRQKGLRMTIQLVRKPPIGKMNGERLKIVLAGSHTIEAESLHADAGQVLAASGTRHRQRRSP
jgi:hypothetical protein